jgi:hypothetical protein
LLRKDSEKTSREPDRRDASESIDRPNTPRCQQRGFSKDEANIVNKTKAVHLRKALYHRKALLNSQFDGLSFLGLSTA